MTFPVRANWVGGDQFTHTDENAVATAVNALHTAFSTADYLPASADGRVRVKAAVDAAVAAIISTGKPQTVVIHAPLTFTTGTSFGPLAVTADPVNYEQPHMGVALPVNLSATLNIVFAPGARITLSAECYNAFFINKVADYNVFRNVSFYNAWVDGNNIGPPGAHHALIGNNMMNNNFAMYLSFQDINFFGRTRLTNIYFNQAGDTSHPADPIGQIGIVFVGQHNTALEATQTFTKNIYVENIEQLGGNGPFMAAALDSGTGPGGVNHYHDNIVVGGYRYIVPSIPTNWQYQTGIFICGAGFGDYCYIGPGYVENVADDAIEVGAMQRVEIVSPRSKNPRFEGIFLRQIHAPIDVNKQQITIRDMRCDVTSALTALTGPSGVPLALRVDGQVIDLTSTATGATFTLTVPGKGTTSSLNWNATSTQVANALIAIGCTGSIATGGPLNTTPITAWIHNVSLRAPVTITSSLTGGSLSLTLNETYNPGFGTITVEDMTANIDGMTFTHNSSTDGLIVYGLEYPHRKFEVIRPKVRISNYTHDQASVQTMSMYRPSAPYAGWGHFIMRDSQLTLGGVCDFTGPGDNTMYWFEVLVDGAKTVVDIDGMTSDRKAAGGTGWMGMIGAAQFGGVCANVRINARNLRPTTVSAASPWLYVGVDISSGGTVAQFDVFDSDFSQGTNSSGFASAMSNSSAGSNLLVVRTRGNIYNGATDPATVFGTVLDGLTGTGSPEGVVTGPVGSRFLRTDGGAGTTLYMKTSGTGNTGWAAI